MNVEKLDEHVYLIDVETGGLENFIASYVLKGSKAAIIETGPTSSIPNLLSGLRKINVKANDVAYVAVTHIHLDHGGGVGTLMKSLPNAKVVAHPAAVHTPYKSRETVATIRRCSRKTDNRHVPGA